MSYKTASLTYCLAKSLRTVVRPLYRWHVFRTFDMNNVETNDSLGYIEKEQELIYQFGCNCLLTDKGYYVLMPDSRDVAFDNLKVTVYDADANDVGIVYLNIADLTGLLATRDFAEKNLCVLTSPSNTYLDNQIIREVDVNADDGVSVYFYSSLFRVTGKDSRSSNPINITLQEAPDWQLSTHFQKDIGNYLSLQKWCDRMIQTVPGARIEIRLPNDLPVYIYELSVVTMEGEYITTWELDENQSGVFYFDAYKDCIIILNKYCPYCLYSAYTTHSNGNGIDWVYNTTDNGVTATYSRICCGIDDKIDDGELHTEVYDSILTYKQYFSSQYPDISFPYDEFPPMFIDKNTEYSISFNSLLWDGYNTRPLLNNIVLVDWFTNEVIKVLTAEDVVLFLNNRYYWNEVVTRPTIIQSSVTDTLGQTFEVPITIHYSLGINILDILGVSGDILDLGNNTLVANVISGGVIEIQYDSEFPSYISASCGVSTSIMPSGTNTLVSSRIYHTRQGGMADSYTITITTESPTCIYSGSRSVNIPSSTVFKGGDNPTVFKVVTFSKEDKSYVYTSTNNKDINRNYTSIPMVFANNAVVQDISIYSDVSASETFSIECGCFLNCVSLKTVDFCLTNNPFTLFLYRALYNCPSLTAFTAPIKTTELGELCLKSNISLSDIDLGNCSYLSNIGRECFADNVKLSNIILPKSLKSLGAYCFKGDVNLSYVTSVEGLTNNKGVCFKVDGDMKNTMEKVLEGTFANCTNIQTVQLPNSVYQINTLAFQGCNNLTYFKSPGLYILYNDVFKDTWIHDYYATSDLEDSGILLYSGDKLMRVPGTLGILYYKMPVGSHDYECTMILPDPNLNEFILYKRRGSAGSSVFNPRANIMAISPYGYARNESTLFGLGEYTVDLNDLSKLKYIGHHAFSGTAISLISLSSNGAIKYLGPSAFKNCKRLQNVLNFQSQSITKIEDYTFYNCGTDKYGLGSDANSDLVSNFYLPDTTTEIGNYAFANCPQLMRIENITTCPIHTVGKYAFQNCFNNAAWRSRYTGFITGAVAAAVAIVATLLFGGHALGCSLAGAVVPWAAAGTEAAWIAAEGVIGGLCIVGSAGMAYHTATDLKEHYLAVTEKHNLRWMATQHTSNLLMPKLKNIGEGAFKDCKYLGGITLSSSTSLIPDYAFLGCKRFSFLYFLEETYDPAGNLVHSVVPGYNLQYIGKQAFQGCEKMELISMLGLFSMKLAFIEDEAFDGVEIYKNENNLGLALSGSILSIGKNALNCKQLPTIIWATLDPSNITLGANAFGSYNNDLKFAVPKGSKSKFLSLLSLYKNAVIEEVELTDDTWKYLKTQYGFPIDWINE